MAEHLDHLHYLNDILCLRIDNLNEVLTLHLLNRLFIPLYIYSLVRNPVASSSLEVKYTFSSTFYKTLLNFIFCFVNYFPCCAKKTRKKNTGLVLLQLDYTTRKFFCSSMIVSFRTFKHQTYVLWLDTFFESNVKTCQNLSKNGFCPFSLIYIYFSKEINYFKPNLRFCHLKASSSTLFGFSLKKNSTFKYLEFFFRIYHDLLQKKVLYFFHLIIFG